MYLCTRCYFLVLIFGASLCLNFVSFYFVFVLVFWWLFSLFVACSAFTFPFNLFSRFQNCWFFVTFFWCNFFSWISFLPSCFVCAIFLSFLSFDFQFVPNFLIWRRCQTFVSIEWFKKYRWLGSGTEVQRWAQVIEVVSSNLATGASYTMAWVPNIAVWCTFGQRRSAVRNSRKAHSLAALLYLVWWGCSCCKALWFSYPWSCQIWWCGQPAILSEGSLSNTVAASLWAFWCS